MVEDAITEKRDGLIYQNYSFTHSEKSRRIEVRHGNENK